jgi:hypothetical protein
MKKLLPVDPGCSLKNQLTEALMKAVRNVAWENLAQGKSSQGICLFVGGLGYGFSVLQIKFFLHVLYLDASEKKMPLS